MHNSKVNVIRSTALITILASLFSGCASIVGNPDQQLVFNSVPNKAEVYIDGTKRGTTPVNLLVARRRPPPQIVLKMEGYEDAPVVFTSKYNILMYLNVLWSYSSTTAFLIDMNSANSVMYWPDNFLVTLEPIPGESKEEKEKASKERTSSKIVRFVVTNYDALVIEISRGSGDHLRALFDLLETPEDKISESLAAIKKLYIQYDDPVKLGKAIEMEIPRRSDVIEDKKADEEEIKEVISQ